MTQIEDVENLADIVADSLNKKLKGNATVYAGADVETPSDLIGFVSTGCTSLDLAISNRPHGGIPLGRITELTGLEGSGKSLVSAHILANIQKQGGVAVLIDTEAAVNWEFFEALGLDRTKNFVYAPISTVEDVFDAVTNIIESVRKSNRDTPVVIVIDSMAGASTKKEMEAGFDRDGYATDKAMIIGKAMRKITLMLAQERVALVITNQLRHKMNAMPFGDPYTTSGGKAIGFHSSVRIRFSQAGAIKISSSNGKETIGVKLKAKVVKNRAGPPLRTAEFEIFFDRGIDDQSSWLKFLRDNEIVTGRSNALKYIADNGTEFKFTENEWASLMEDYPDLQEEIYSKLCDLYIMKYSSQSVSRENMEVTEDEEEI